MPRQEDIRNTFWRDLDDLSNDAMLLYLWSWTNERCGAAGFYSCPKRLLLEGRLQPKQLDAALAECVEAGKLVYEGGVLWSVTRVKRLGWKNPQAEKSIRNELAELGADNPIHASFIARYDGFPWGKEGKGRLCLTDGSPMGPRTHTDGSDKGQPTHEENPDAEPKPPPPSMGQPTHAGNSNSSGSGNSNGNSGASSTSVDVVDDAPPALGAVAEALGRIAEIRGCPFPAMERIAAAIAAYPDADHIGRASDMEDWLCNSDHGKRQTVKDLVQTYRNQLRGKTGKPAGGDTAEDFAEYDQAVVTSG